MPRRVFFASVAAGLASQLPPAAWAAPYQDPKGEFALELPDSYYKIRRTVEGDVSRKGNAIFSAGNLKLMETVSLERYNVQELVDAVGLGAFYPEGSAAAKVKRWSTLGSPAKVAQFFAEKRDAERAGAGATTQASTVVTGSVVAGAAVTAIAGSDGGATGATVAGGGDVDRLSFDVLTVLRDKDGLEVVRRLTRGVVELQPGGTVVALWVGAPAGQWAEDVNGPMLAGIAASLDL